MSSKADHVDRDEGIKKVAALIKDVRIAMLTTEAPDGTLRSRPMGVQKIEFDGTLWFFTNATEPKVDDVEREEQVGVSISNPKDNVYISISGQASVVRDRKKMEELWDKSLKTWFPKELEDPELALLRIDVEHAQYWDEGGLLTIVPGFIKAVVTGQRSDAGYGTKVDM